MAKAWTSAAIGAIVAVAAEKPYAEMHGDIVFPATMRHSARYPDDLAALERVAGKGVPVVTMLCPGSPVPANDLINRSDAFIAAWLPGTEGQGIADLLFAGATAGQPMISSAGSRSTGRRAIACRGGRHPVPARIRPHARGPLEARPPARGAGDGELPRQ